MRFEIGYAREFLKEVQKEFEFEIKSIQVDGGANLWVNFKIIVSNNK